MKKSTKELIIFTILGIVASIIFYQLNNQPNPMMTTSGRAMISTGMYLSPFIGLIYWLFTRQFDE